MKKIFFLLLVAVCCSVTALAADRTVTGTVYSDVDDEPLIGATVLPLPKGSGQGTATDVDGHFSLQIPESCKELQVSFIGMQTKNVHIPDNGEVVVRLQSGENRLEEVMVVAYGTAKRAEFTGSASVVKADQIADALATSVTSVLQGKVSGVQTLSSDGRPGGAPKLRIRGVGSINASQDPLYVVDGVPYDGAISDLASSEIESMTVLKDAASTALYGARGANGVVLITTKRGAEGAAKITFDARWGGNTRGVPNYNVLQSTEQYYELMYRGLYNQLAATPGYTPESAWRAASNKALTATGYQIFTLPAGEFLFNRAGKLNPNAQLGYSDGTFFYTPDNWADNTLRTGLRQDYSLSISGGTDKIKYYASASYLGDEGVVQNSSFNRISTRASVDYQAKKWLKVGTTLNYTNTRSDYPGDNDLETATSSANAFYIVNQIAPVYPIFIRDAQGNVMTDSSYGYPLYDYGSRSSAPYHNRNWMSMSNPAGKLLYDTAEYFSDVFDGKWNMTITPIDGLSIIGNAGYWVSSDRAHIIGNPFYGQSAESGGYAQQSTTHSRSVNLQAMATYNHTFAGKHNMDLMVGYETYNLRSEYLYGVGYNLYLPDGWNVSNTIDKKDTGGGRDVDYSTRGIFARAKYNYDGRYFFHASYRRDASSRFAPGHRWGNFFSVSGAWDVAKEPFMNDVYWLDQLKIKASFGQNGNDNLGSLSRYYYAWADQYQVTGADGIWTDATLIYKGNRNITWETSNSLNAGFEFSLWQGKLDGSIEYYQRQVSDMLFFLPAPTSLGYSSYPTNVGSMRNYGVEIELNYNIFNSKDFSWSVNANLTTAGNRVIKLPADLVKDGQWLSGTRIFKEGESMYNLYLVQYAGVDKSTGEALYRAEYTDEWMKAHPEITSKEFTTANWQDAYSGNPAKGIADSRKATGNIMPKVYGGFGTNLYFRGIDFSMSFAYQAGGRILDYTYQDLMHSAAADNLGQNWHVDMIKAWTPENTNTDVPRINSADTYTNATSDRFLVSSNFLSLNNITLGYTLPQKWTRTIGIESLRIYGAAENVALWTKRRGLDPRQGYVNSDNSTYSPIRTISGGIRVQF
ncbi:MAG: TonB-dependent receptor [Muribaculaceae bacterium]|nr:TonB-dependent receptor [Muribaculaceae bacterium]